MTLDDEDNDTECSMKRQTVKQTRPKAECAGWQMRGKMCKQSGRKVMKPPSFHLVLI